MKYFVVYFLFSPRLANEFKKEEKKKKRLEQNSLTAIHSFYFLSQSLFPFSPRMANGG
jgi:hypothetical protein